MGQTKETHLVRLWAEDTVDEAVYKLQEKKTEVVEYTLQDDGHIPKELTWEEKEALLTPEPARKKTDREDKATGKRGAAKTAEAIAAQKKAMRAIRGRKARK